MKHSRILVCLSAAMMFTFAAIGCGSGNSTLPATAVASTSNPLVAQYTITYFHPGLTAWVEFGPDTSYGRQTSMMTSSVGVPGSQVLNILVAGMKPRTTYHMRAHVNWAGGSFVDQDQIFTTAALPASQPLPQFTITQPAAGTLPPGLGPAQGVELLSLVAPAGSPGLQAVVTDLQGNMIWYCPEGGLPAKPMQNGHFILNLGSDLREVDLACTTIRDVSLTQVTQSLQAGGYSFTTLSSFHHDQLVLPNGHWIALAQTIKEFTDLPGYPGTTSAQGDVLVDIDPKGNVVWAWSSFDHLDINRHLGGLPDWTHSNAIVSTPDGNLLLSMRNQSWILKIDYANGTGSGNVSWKLGEGGDFTLLGGDPSQWFYGQHYPNLLSTDGSQTTMAVFDDGNLRIDSDGVACGTTSSAPPCHSRAVIYQLDESTNLASVLWQDLPGLYTFWGGSIDVLSNGDVEFNLSEPFGNSASQIMEVTQTDSPQTVWQMNITNANAYRGYRIPSLYPGVTWQQ